MEFTTVNANLDIMNFDCSDTKKYPYITVRAWQGKLWYYGADETYENAQRTLKYIDNGFIIKV